MKDTYWGRPIPAFGDPLAALLIVGLAPAAHGGNRTGRIFTGDSSGDWLFEALHRFGFASLPHSLHRDDGQKLDDCIITAALRCAPPENKPLARELANCRHFLQEELQLLENVRVIIALGQIAFRSVLLTLKRLEITIPEPSPRFYHAAEWRLENGTTLIASYHPSRQNTQTGKLTREMFHAVFLRARKILRG